MSRLIIEAGRTERHYWRDLWRYRELFYFLAWRDFLIRYKQTFVGVFWALIRPVLTMFILTMVGKFGTPPVGSLPNFPTIVRINIVRTGRISAQNTPTKVCL